MIAKGGIRTLTRKILLPPQDSASTNFATSAKKNIISKYISIMQYKMNVNFAVASNSLGDYIGINAV